MPISSVTLKEKAMEISKELNIEDFGSRNVWNQDGWNVSMSDIAVLLKRFAEKQQLLMVMLYMSRRTVFLRKFYRGLMYQMFLILMRPAYFTVFIPIKICHLRMKSALLEKQANKV